MTGPVQLWITPTSPYARLARIIVREKGLGGTVTEHMARTRESGSPFYTVNPSGRVPCLVLPDGTVMEESALICDWLDESDGHPCFARPMGEDRWDFAMAEVRARSLLDGLAVWLREMKRPEDERSPGVIAHEVERARRLLAMWEDDTDNRWLTGDLNHVQMALVAALDTLGRLDDPPAIGPNLAAWHARISTRPSIAETAP